ncbi:MAG: class I SAM-dependent methyltransferase [Desulfocapsaceae bacterium]
MYPEESSGYEDEPREHFHPLPPDLHHLLYHYERLSHDLQTEQHFYRRRLQGRCTRLLELGCGTGLLANDLQLLGFDVTGIDIDHQALSIAKDSKGCRLVQMDMCRLGFQPCFEAALIGQNTLNLLADKDQIRCCLDEIRRILVPPGIIIAHLYCTESAHLLPPGERLLQFYLFEHPEGGKIIKETIRSFDYEKQRLLLEQRFKIRRFNTEMVDSNYRHFLQLAALSRADWLEIFRAAGFTIESCLPGFSESSPSSGSALHLIARSV